MTRWRYLWIGFTPFIWHWPQMDRGLEADPVLRVGPISVSGIWPV